MTGLRPLDAAVPAALQSPEIAFHLVPLPKPNSGARMMSGRINNGTNGSHMIPRKQREKAKAAGPTWYQRSSNTKIASV